MKNFLVQSQKEHLLPERIGLSDEEYVHKYLIAHNASVRQVFAHCPSRLLEVAITDPDAAQKIRDFTGYPICEIPHANKTQVTVYQ
jgi:hypothetical protein